MPREAAAAAVVSRHSSRRAATLVNYCEQGHAEEYDGDGGGVDNDDYRPLGHCVSSRLAKKGACSVHLHPQLQRLAALVPDLTLCQSEKTRYKLAGPIEYIYISTAVAIVTLTCSDWVCAGAGSSLQERKSEEIFLAV